jgi:outer membrane protein assembly factor BamB
VYCFFGKTGVVAFDLDGNKLWDADVGSELNGFGTGASPVVAGNLLIVNASVESQTLFALDKKTGKEVWKAKGIREAWNTPVLMPRPGGKSELVLGMQGKVVSFDPATGDQLWSCANDIRWYIVPSVVTHDDIVWSIGGRDGVVACAVKAGGRGDVTQTHRQWTARKGSNVTSPVVHDGHLYWMNDNLGVAYCAEAATGTIVYEERMDRPGQVYASALLADGNVYYLTRDGRTLVLAAKPKFEKISLNDLGDRSTFNASPAVHGNRLLIRSDKFLYCVGK